MERRLRLNLILLAAAGLLGLLIWWLQPARYTPVTAIDPARVDRIEISDLTGRHIRLHKVGDVWQAGTEPANQQRIAQLLGICTTPSLERFPAPDDLAPFGLDPAPVRLRLNELTLDVGNTDPIHGWRYMRIGQQIHLIADGFYHHLTAPPAAWQAAP